jgi:hypothetical protein
MAGGLLQGASRDSVEQQVRELQQQVPVPV